MQRLRGHLARLRFNDGGKPDNVCRDTPKIVTPMIVRVGATRRGSGYACRRAHAAELGPDSFRVDFSIRNVWHW